MEYYTELTNPYPLMTGPDYAWLAAQEINMAELITQARKFQTTDVESTYYVSEKMRAHEMAMAEQRSRHYPGVRADFAAYFGLTIGDRLDRIYNSACKGGQQRNR